MDEKEFDGLYAKLGDLKKRTIHGELGISAFLSPKELHYADIFLKREGCAYLSFGGYEDAERRRIYLLPEYMEYIEYAKELADFGFDTRIAAIKIKGSGFERLSHRDFMGAVLGLGIERGVVGDILLTEDTEAIVLCDVGIATFLQSELETVGRDKVRVSSCELPENFSFKRKYASVSDTVASNRLDAIVGALCSLSREKAKEAVLSGLVELDYETEERPDREVKAQSIVSVRGYGKFRIISVEDKTRKGRYRLLGEKFL